MQGLRRPAQLARREAKFRARRPSDGLVGSQVLLADDSAARSESSDQVRHEASVDVAHPDDEIETALGQRALGIVIEIRAEPVDGEAALCGDAPSAVEPYARNIERSDLIAVGCQEQCVATRATS